ncbi:glycosyltransferase [Riemerella anatipestifer]|uniref:glycosyltransferase n=1 Tax=Riemerella anatipestifer TaxID=34085 RepID=UPI002A8664C1|nr:glycosyltransferase [Riemerella anatipestifer]
MTKAIFFVTGLDSGGIENYLLRFIQEKHLEYSEIVVYCKGGKGGQLEAEYKQFPNVKIVVNTISFFNPLHYYNLFRFLKRNQFDVVCDFTGNFAGLVLQMAYYANIRNRVGFYRGSSDHFKTNLIKQLYNNWVKYKVRKYATNILSNSKAALDYFFPQAWQKDDRYKVLYNGINPNKFNASEDLRDEFGLSRESFVIGHTGRYNEAKNHDVIIKVAEILCEKYNDIYFILCGNGVKVNLEAYLKQKGLEQRILVFENRRDIPQFLKTMDVYFFPSITEGQPNALLEALLMGLPFVASNILPIQEVVPSIFKKYLSAPDNVETFVSLLEEVKHNPISSEEKKELQKYITTNFNATKQFGAFNNILKSNTKMI